MRRLRTRHFIVLALASFIVGLIATLPATLVLKTVGMGGGQTAVGTIWKGETAIGDATALSWRFAPLRSLMELGLATDITMRGGETDIAARGLWRPGRMVLRSVSGIAGLALVNTAISDLPITCDLSFKVDFDRVILAGRRSGAEGRIRSEAGRCSARNGVDAPPADIPAMVGRSIMTDAGASAWLAPASQPDGARLVQMTIDPTGRLTATVLPAGALLLPATAGRMAIETQL